MLFGKTKKAGDSQPAPSGDAELKSVTENIYKQNLELAVKNKTLSLLGQLYEISIQTLSSKELAQRITVSIQQAFDFERVGILLYDATADSVSALAFSESSRFHEARSVANEFFDSMSLTKASTTGFFGEMIKSKGRGYTEDIAGTWGWGLDAEAIRKIQEAAHVKAILAYPLIINDSVKGFFVLTLNRVNDDLTDSEKESIRSLINVISVALDKARLYEALEDANKQQVVLIHFITHQIKGFVTKSRNIFSLMLEGDYGPLPAAMRPMIEEGFRSDTKGAQTIQEILSAANIKSGKVSYDMQPFDLKALIEEIVNDLRPAAIAKQLELKLSLGDAPLEYVGDRAQLQNALKNLIDNSIKYTPSGSVDISLAKTDGTIRFEIKDTGVGITAEDMAHLFTEGGHGKESQKVNVESTGFGLYIVKSIIEGHKGTVRVESEGAGKGSHFIVELPIPPTA